MSIEVLSFGYELGDPPADAKWVADVRNIPASSIDGLWQMNGHDKAVAEKVLATPEAKAWLKKFRDDVMPELEDGDLIAIGCSIGVHRSVAIADAIAEELRSAGFQVTRKDRDLAKRRDTRASIEPMEGLSNMTAEVRATSSGELRFVMDGGKPRIDGRAILFDSWSVDLGGFRERMVPGSVTLDTDLVALFDHATDKVLGRISAGTMEAREDDRGVAFTAYPPETSWAADLRVSMERGDIKGCSYRMLVDEDRWYVENGMVCRDVLKARVSEVTVTSMPAYPETTAAVRSQAEALAKAAKSEERVGRVLSDANAQILKGVFQNIELASDTLEALLVANDPTFNEDAYGLPESADEVTDGIPDAGHTPGSDIIAGGSPDAADRSSVGATETPQTRGEVFVPFLGFIPTRKES